MIAPAEVLVTVPATVKLFAPARVTVPVVFNDNAPGKALPDTPAKPADFNVGAQLALNASVPVPVMFIPLEKYAEAEPLVFPTVRV